MTASDTGRRPIRRHPPDEDTEQQHERAKRERCLEPELVGEQLDKAVGSGVEGIRPAGEEESMEDLERGVESERPDDADDEDTDRKHHRTAPNGTPEPGRSTGEDVADEEHDERRSGEQGKANEDPSDVDHVGPLTRVQDGLAGDDDVEVRWPHDQVRQDRSGGLLELRWGVARPRVCSRPALLERDPDRVDEGNDRHGEDDDAGGDPDEDGGRATAEAVDHP